MKRGQALVVTGTDTGVGKTAFSAMLALALDACYWKPIQSGLGPYWEPSGMEGDTDTERVRNLTGLGPERFLPERYVLTQSLSPHRSAEIDSIQIDPDALETLPETDKPLIIETAGGLLVPITREFLQIELLARWRAPVILCAHTKLGTINHTLLSLEALNRREIPILGVAFIGEANEDSERTICEMTGVRRLGRLPWLERLGPDALRRAFTECFSKESFNENSQRQKATACP